MKKVALVLILIVMAGIVGTVMAGPTNFVAHLTGDQEVANPPVVTRAQGQAVFNLRGENDLHFRLMIANIQNVTQAHIHCGAAGINGPVVVWLYPEGPPPMLIPGRSSGVLSSGVVTNANVIPRNNAACLGEVNTLADVLTLMETGHAYVNVHTTAYPAGEVRGQINLAGLPRP